VLLLVIQLFRCFAVFVTFSECNREDASCGVAHTQCGEQMEQAGTAIKRWPLISTHTHTHAHTHTHTEVVTPCLQPPQERSVQNIFSHTEC